ncbi:hypothetical protein QDY71_01785 [Kingella negevensis]|uniref:hypothetical protein n=1 Tax=Kingella negevensis TaxID=1522312 RepID=UPI00254A6560|nr:hypothetical protein [Kingella negevensis]MDK4680205.1 hypothetical protein [Kingella negevensis]MDK4682075.1 hypothetical protein [Kingella negevensis]MDK4684522.1 hypothetical protein [Kingella negevensis]MDK4690271.1 hypothetical protein [Kingella negevensis]MDK4692383.1 hypothetical protein [Kingella negevensis]
MQDSQSLDKFQAMQLAAMLITAQANPEQDEKLVERMLNLAELIREKDTKRVRERLGTPRLGC